ncbi:MAG: HD family hydrolase [Burkholderiaceae bacterium]|nr:HD family hydrolase [Burkholderiaceae bacterium]
MHATIQTASGRYANLVAPLPHHIDIGDIAHALSNICRFGGHTREFYSVAQHSVLVSRIVPHEHALAALLHDAAEAYVGDVTLPLKQLLPDYRTIEASIWRAIASSFDLPADLPACVKRADLVLLATERRDLMKEQDTPWPVLDGVPPLPAPIDPWPPSHARAMFVMRYWDLRKEAA